MSTGASVGGLFPMQHPFSINFCLGHFAAKVGFEVQKSE
jgi:hypothetical protein